MTFSMTLGVHPTPAAAAASGRTLSQAVRAVTSGDELPEQATVHLGKAYDHFNAGSYAKAESEFKRAAFFAPEWTPMTYNLAVVAEAQGHLGEALDRYEAYRPNAEGDTGLIVDQRIAELNDRKKNLKKVDRRQLILGSVAVGTGVAAIGGGVGLFLLKRDLDDQSDALDPAMTEKKANLDTKAKNYYLAGYVLAIYGGLALVYGGLYLSKVIKNRKAKKMALRPTHNGVAVTF